MEEGLRPPLDHCCESLDTAVAQNTVCLILSLSKAPSRRRKSPKLADHLDRPDNVRVELWQLLCRNPVFPTLLPAGVLHRIPSEVARSHRKLRDKTRARLQHVPVARDLLGVFERRDRIEDRLIGKPRRKFAKSACADQVELFRPDRTIERDSRRGVACHAAFAGAERTRAE